MWLDLTQQVRSNWSFSRDLFLAILIITYCYLKYDDGTKRESVSSQMPTLSAIVAGFRVLVAAIASSATLSVVSVIIRGKWGVVD